MFYEHYANESNASMQMKGVADTKKAAPSRVADAVAPTEIPNNQVDGRVTDSVSRGFSDLDFSKFLLAIGFWAAVRTIAQQPISVALTRKQACPLHANLSTYAIMRKIHGNEGGVWNGLMRGGTAIVFAQILTDMITLGMFEYARENFPWGETASTYLGSYIGDAMCQSIRIPFLVVATRQMLNTNMKRESIRHTFQQVHSTGGVRALYAGLGTTLLVGSQWTAMWWLCYNKSKEMLYSQYRSRLGLPAPDADPNPAARLSRARERLGPLARVTPQWALDPDDNTLLNTAASCFTSAATAVMFNPYLVIRTRLQSQSGGTILSVSRQVLKQGGVRAFWNGTVLSINACIVDAWLASTTYEWAKLYSDKTRG